MKLLVANLGSTSFKYGLYGRQDAALVPLARGGFERVTDYEACIGEMENRLQQEGHLDPGESLDAVGFKTVLGQGVSGCVEADETVLEALEGFQDVAPAHNPVYAEGIRSFARRMPQTRRVALFETAFYQWVPEAATAYAVPVAWRELGIRRYGFHGASHKYIAERSAELLDRPQVAERVRGLYTQGPGEYEGAPSRVISCHLGGSSSVTGICNGIAIGTSMGFSPQSGLPQNNRVGDLDAMAVPYACKHLGISPAEAERQLSTEGGLLGLSGLSNDVRDLEAAADEGHAGARFALEVLTASIRQWMGGFFFEMGGAEAIVFTAGIGENSPRLRSAVCEGLESLGIQLDEAANAETVKGLEGKISTPDSPVQVWVIPANEEWVVAREVEQFLEVQPTPTP
jgi:acetate kinase